MAKIQIPDVDCLYCKIRGACITDSDKIETLDNIIVRPIICQRCGKGWKDFYSGSSNEDSILLSLSRNNNNDNNRSDNTECDSSVSESEKDD